MWELDELTYGIKVEDPFIATIVDDVDIEDVERHWAGLVYEGGGAAARGRLNLFVEEWTFDQAAVDDEATGFGLELGLAGDPTFGTGSVQPLVDYDLGVSIHILEGDEVFGRMGILNGVAHLGAGLQFGGVQITGGAMGIYSWGAYELLEEIEEAEGIEDDGISGTNIGGYVRLRWIPESAPLRLDVKGAFGQTTGLTAALGLAF